MRSLCSLLLTLTAFLVQAGACAQTQGCTGGTTTTISGVVYAPNGVDPLPDVLVFVPTVTPDAFSAGVSCPVPGTPPSGKPVAGATTAVDGSFTIPNAPAGTNVPLVIQTGRWRRQFTISTVTACTDNPQTGLRFPKNQGEGDIPKFAISTGGSDQVECVLHKIGIDNAEFTNPGGTGRINLFQSDAGPGARIDTGTPKATALMGDLATLEGYDVLMLPCEGSPATKPAAQLANLVSFANAGGRVYSSHYSYDWLYTNVPFNTVANWSTNQNIQPDAGVATIDTSFSDGQTLAQWLQLVGATTTLGQMPISTLRKNLTSVNAPTQSYMTLNNAAYGNPVMQFVFDTPVGTTINQCGRVLFDEYHVENPPSTPANMTFPQECASTAGTFSPQEKLLEYSIFELTGDGAAATLAPKTQDFGSEPIGFSSNPQTFTWTNNSTFPSGVTLLSATGDFAVMGSNCTTVAAGASCRINVTFTPTTLGARTGVLTVGSPGSNLTAALTGTGVPALTISSVSQDFGNVDVGAHLTRSSLSVVNQAPAALPLPALIFTGPGAANYVVANSCNGVVPTLGTCLLTIVFTPSITGPLPATLTVNASGAPQVAMLTGNGVDFSVADAPASGSVIAGYSQAFTFTTTPIAGFGAPLSVSCSTTMPASTCSISSTSVISTSPTALQVTITTTSKYTVVGYTGGFGTGLWSLLAVGSAGLLWWRRRMAGHVLRVSLVTVALAAVSLVVTGCSSVLPAQNPVYTPAGDYTLTVTATDGFLVHSATYALHVTVK